MTRKHNQVSAKINAPSRAYSTARAYHKTIAPYSAIKGVQRRQGVPKGKRRKGVSKVKRRKGVPKVQRHQGVSKLLRHKGVGAVTLASYRPTTPQSGSVEFNLTMTCFLFVKATAMGMIFSF